MQKSLSFSLVLALAALLSGCDRGSQSQPASPSETRAATVPQVTPPPTQPVTPPVPVTAPVDPEASVVTVNGTRITEARVAEELAMRLAAQRQRLPAGMEIPAAQRQMLRQEVVDMMVEMELISQKLAEQNITVTDEQVDAELRRLAGPQDPTLADLQQEIAQHGMTLAHLKEQLGLKLRMDALMEADMAAKPLTEADVRAFYDQNAQHFTHAEQVKASHILLGKRGITEAEYPAELEKIQAAKARLEAGESFADVARAVSSCPSSAEGGDLGFFDRGRMDPAFEKVAFELEVGQTSDIVRTSFGYHLIRVTDRRPAGTTPFAEVQEQLREHLTRQQQQEFWSNQLETLKANATIAYSPGEQAARQAAEQAQQEMMQQMIRQQLMQQLGTQPPE